LTTQVLLALALGLSVGSFINVVADRLPRGESLFHVHIVILAGMSLLL